MMNTSTGETFPTFRDVDALRAYVARHGDHTFDRDTMRFFHSRVSDTLHGGRFLVTSESDGTMPRRYTVRFVRDNGDGGVSVLSTGFQRYADNGAAHRAAARLAARVAAGDLAMADAEDA